MDRRTVCWFSAGAASAVATKLTLRDNPDAVVAYCETGAEHPDNERFVADCERWFGRPVERLRSERYASTWEVFEKRRVNGGGRRRADGSYTGAEALKVWRDKDVATNAAAARITGWSVESLTRKFGGSGRRMGRPVRPKR